jgi:hypothetical protein
VSGPVLYTVTAAIAATGGDDVKQANASGYSPDSVQRLSVAAGHAWHYLDGTQGGTFSKAATVVALGLVDNPRGYLIVISTAAPWSDGQARPTIVQILTTSAVTPAPPPPDGGGADADAVRAERDDEWREWLLAGSPGEP